MTGLSILGCTGSLGRQVCEVAECLGIPVASLAGWKGQEVLAGQVRSLRPSSAVCEGPAGEELARAALSAGTALATGEDGLLKVASQPNAGPVVVAIAGMPGLPPMMAAARAGRRVIAGCKEGLVAGGMALVREAALSGGCLRPLDSEHVAADLLIDLAGGPDEVAELVMTGSGGSVRDVAPEDLAALPVSRVLDHPVWRMGRKLTVDSATLVNKAMEVLEASVLFGLPVERIRVAFDPSAMTHAVVRAKSGYSLAFQARPDMRVPIMLALGMREEAPFAIVRGAEAESLLAGLRPPSPREEAVIALAYEAAAPGGCAPAALVGADEVAVELFLDGEIPFTAIVPAVREAMEAVIERTAVLDPTSIEDCLGAAKMGGAAVS